MIRPIGLLAVVTVALIVLARSVRAQDKPKPPGQPTSGPGGADYPHKQVVGGMYGTGATRYWIFEPGDPKPDSAPLIIFNHGWGAMEPKAYSAWIDHIVKRGNIVVYPVYQDSLRTPTYDFTANATAGIRSAIEKLQTEPGHVKPQLDKVAVVGHSMGGAITANIAALAVLEGLPQPKAVMSVEPGDGTHRFRRINFPKADWSKIPPETLLLTVVGEDDRLAGDEYARLIFQGVPQIPRENKNYITMRSDRHGSPALVANHFAPCSIRVAADALKYYGFWKLFDGLCDAAFYRKNREYALGNTPQQRFMGKWSDGTPVKELQVATVP